MQHLVYTGDKDNPTAWTQQEVKEPEVKELNATPRVQYETKTIRLLGEYRKLKNWK